MKGLITRHVGSFLQMAFVITLGLVGSEVGWAQGKNTIRFTNLPQNTTFTGQHRFDAGDVPGHYVRIYEIQRRYPIKPPKFNGIAAPEQWDRGYSDYTNLNGRAWWYTTFYLENGDKIYARADGTTQTKNRGDQSSSGSFFGIMTITGGTGQFKGIRGLLHTRILFNPETGFNIGKFKGEYWFEE